MAAAAILQNGYISATVWPISMKFDMVTQFHPCADANWDSSDDWKVKLKWEVELFQYGGLLFHAAGTGCVGYYVSLTFSRKTANINVKKMSFY